MKPVFRCFVIGGKLPWCSMHFLRSLLPTRDDFRLNQGRDGLYMFDMFDSTSRFFQKQPMTRCMLELCSTLGCQNPQHVQDQQQYGQWMLVEEIMHQLRYSGILTFLFAQKMQV